MIRAAAPILAALLAVATPVLAQDTAQDIEVDVSQWVGKIEPVSGFTGQMSMTMETEVPEDMAVEDVIRFEPWQMLDDLFRDDVVFLMRSGPTEWDVQDAADTGPEDCESQRLLSEDGHDRMRQLGALLIVNDLRPGEIRLSEWCRAQQSYLGLEKGMLEADMKAIDGMSADTSSALNPLGLQNGTSDVEGLRSQIAEWDGGDGDGPLMLITHFDNIVELTRFRLYEGEMLIIDPKRDGRVLGYLRLGSAAPDLVHFPEDVVEYARQAAGGN